MAATAKATKEAGDRIRSRGEIGFNHTAGRLIALGRGAITGLRGEIELGQRKRTEGSVLEGITVTDNSVEPSSRTDVTNKLAIGASTATTSVMVNALYVFELGWVRPYVGLGIGWARHKVKMNGDHASIGQVEIDIPQSAREVSVTAYQTMAGVLYDVSKRSKLRIG